MYQDSGQYGDWIPPQPVITHKTDGLVDGVIVPGLQSAITGILAGFTSGGLSAALKVSASPWQVGFIAGSAAALAGWLSYRSSWQFTLERLLGIDFNRDGIIGQPDQEPAQSLRIELIQDEGKRGDFIDLPYPEKLPKLASGLLRGQQFSQSVWTGNGAVFSRSEFESLRSVLLMRGLARWKKVGIPAQGIELTPAGRAVFRHIADQPSPSPIQPGCK